MDPVRVRILFDAGADQRLAVQAHVGTGLRSAAEQACVQLQFFLDLKHIFCQNKQKDKIENTG